MKHLPKIRKAIVDCLAQEWLSADDVVATINLFSVITPVRALTPEMFEIIAALLHEGVVVVGSFVPQVDSNDRLVPWNARLSSYE